MIYILVSLYKEQKILSLLASLAETMGNLVELYARSCPSRKNLGKLANLAMRSLELILLTRFSQDSSCKILKDYG